MPYVVKGGSTPLETYSDPVQLSTDYGCVQRNILSYGVQLRRRIDGTVLIVDDNNYFVWSCQRQLASLGKAVQSICIARMTSPTQLDTSTVGILSQPDQPWEQSNIATEPAVNERVEMFDLKGRN